MQGIQRIIKIIAKYKLIDIQYFTNSTGDVRIPHIYLYWATTW